MIRRAEADKICIVHTPGKDLCHSNNVNCLAMPYGQQYSTTVDENYLVIGSHVDAAMQEKIKRGEYIDFAKLIPRDRPVHDDHRLELVSKGGHTYFLLAGDKNLVGITNFGHWEQAFRIYSNVYTKEFPDQATQLIQYNHIIYTASLTYAWEMYICMIVSLGLTLRIFRITVGQLSYNKHGPCISKIECGSGMIMEEA